MKDYLPYIVSVVTALISFLASLLINKKNNKAEIEKIKLEHKQILERNKQEQDARIAQLEKEYVLKAGTDIVTDFTKQTVEALYSTESVKQELNKQTFNSFKNKKRNGKGKKK